ncbi:MAG: parallel beta-helix domain-containing protein [Aquirufa sp.]
MSKSLFLILSIFSFQLFAQADFEKKLQKQLILAEDGSIIQIEAGNFQLTKSLSLEGKKNIIIRGSGIDKTVLSFKGQVQGAEGIKVTNCENIIIEDLTAEDSKGDLIKTMHVKGMTFRRLKTAWTGGPKSTNGSYALYPVLCENVVIDSCIAIGASDAGIYVGQSKNIIVRNCEAYQNVAGIEIENSLNAEVFNNKAIGNTGGILVFDLPDLIQKKGGHVRVYHNVVQENNLKNFAPKGNIVGNVPKGTGMMVLATSDVEIFDNQILNNQTIGVSVVSYFMTELKIKDKEYDPYPTGIFIHDNHFERNAGRAPADSRFGKLYRFKLRFGRKLPFVVYDGILNPEKLGKDGQYYPEYRICVKNNINQFSAMLDAEHDFKNIQIGEDYFNCELGMIKSIQF